MTFLWKGGADRDRRGKQDAGRTRSCRVIRAARKGLPAGQPGWWDEALTSAPRSSLPPVVGPPVKPVQRQGPRQLGREEVLLASSLWSRSVIPIVLGVHLFRLVHAMPQTTLGIYNL